MDARLCWHAANITLSTRAAKLGPGQQHEVCLGEAVCQHACWGLVHPRETGDLAGQYNQQAPVSQSHPSLSSLVAISLDGLVGL